VSIRTLLGSLFAFGALNAFAGGYYGLSGAEGVPREWLARSPFSDYVVPSLVLFVVVGGALALAAIMVFRGHPLARAIACAAAAVLLVWIVVQVRPHAVGGRPVIAQLDSVADDRAAHLALRKFERLEIRGAVRRDHEVAAVGP
jgi:hypothetical protein